MLRVLLIVMILSEFGSNALAGDSCAIDQTSQKKWGHLVGNAGCLVIEKDEKGGVGMLLVKNTGAADRLTPPGGTSEKGESAQCTAVRETYEEAGLKLMAGELHLVFANGYMLFRCRPSGQEAAEILKKSIRNSKFKPAPGFEKEISQAVWMNPQTTQKSNWRFPDQFPGVLGIFEHLAENLAAGTGK